MNAAESAVLDPMVGWLILGAFSALWVALGWYWGHQDKELDEYVLAGRKLGLGLGTATVMANWVTSNTTLLAPQLVYTMGFGVCSATVWAPLDCFYSRPWRHASANSCPRAILPATSCGCDTATRRGECSSSSRYFIASDGW